MVPLLEHARVHGGGRSVSTGHQSGTAGGAYDIAGGDHEQSRPAREDKEIESMGALLDEALDAGCIGMSTGLAYAPAIAAPTDEVVALRSDCNPTAPCSPHT